MFSNTKSTRKRFVIVFLLFVTVMINYIDRANMSIAAPSLMHDFGISNSQLGWVFSSWSWCYALFQLPGGWLADRIKPKILVSLIVLFWSIATCLLGFASTFFVILGLRCLIGLFEAPSYPINSRVVTTWIPDAERATAIAIYTSAQFVGLAFLVPVLAWILSEYGWHEVFFVTGTIGILWALVWYLMYHEPKEYPGINASEITLLEQGGAIPHLQQKFEQQQGKKNKFTFSWADLKYIATRRKIIGLCLGQFGLGSTTIFFLTWFPTYLVEYKGMSFIKAGFAASIPFIFGFIGVICSGVLSDYLLRRGCTLGVARKTPIITGLLLSTTIIGADFVDSQVWVIFFMTIAFFATGFASITWSLMTSISPERLIGMSGGFFNFIGGLAGIVIPLAIGYLTEGKSFTSALTLICCMTFMGAFSYIFLVGKVERIPDRPDYQQRHLTDEPSLSQK